MPPPYYDKTVCGHGSPERVGLCVSSRDLLVGCGSPFLLFVDDQEQSSLAQVNGLHNPLLAWLR